MYDEMIDVPLHSVYTSKRFVGETESHWSQIPTKPQDAEPICAGNAMPSGRASRTSAWLRMGWWDDGGQASLGIEGVNVL